MSVQMSWPKRIIAGVFFLAIGGMVVASLRPRKEKPVEVQLGKAQRGAITRKVTGAGKLQPATQVKVSSNISGDLIELLVKEGDHVKKGQLLARIDARRYQAQVRQQEASRASTVADVSLAKVQVERLRAERDRVKKLLASNSASPAELERAEADLAAEQARLTSSHERSQQSAAVLSEATQQLRLTTIYAPIDGVVTSRMKQVGERVRGSDFSEDVLLVISTLNTMEAKIEVGENEVVYLALGNKADVEIDAFPEKKWPAEIIEVAQNANIKNPGTEAEVTTFPVRLALTAAVPGALPGMSAEVNISTETHDQAIIVPIQAVTVRSDRDLDKNRGKGPGSGAVMEGQVGQVVGAGKKPRREAMHKIVFVVEDGMAKARKIETGLASENEIEILSGLKEGDVIIQGPFRVLAKELADEKPVEEEKKDKDKKKGDNESSAVRSGDSEKRQGRSGS